MSETNDKGLTPHGTGRFIAPLYQEYLKRPYISLNRPFSYHDLRDLITQCAIFLIRDRSKTMLNYNEAFEKFSEMIAERNAFGEKKYGEGLRADNGYEAALLALEELADAGMYCTMKIEENDSKGMKVDNYRKPK